MNGLSNVDHAAHCGPSRGGFRVCYCRCPKCQAGGRCVCSGCRALPTCAGNTTSASKEQR